MEKELESILITKQINPTAMRLLVLEYVLKQKASISLSDLEKEFERSNRTTLYRTLKTFEEMGMIHNIKDGAEAVIDAASAFVLFKDKDKDINVKSSFLHFGIGGGNQKILDENHCLINF